MTENEREHHEIRDNLVVWITSIRGVLVIFLGLSLLVIPDKTFRMLGNFMGLFWLMTGIISVRQEAHKRGDHLSLVAGVIGVLTGLLAITRSFTQQWFGEDVIMTFLAIVIVLTGFLHVVGGFRIGKQAERGRTSLSILLGIFEFVLGILLLLGKREEQTSSI